MVHETSEKQLDFQKKNFRYVTKPFGEFAQQIKQGSRQYLRSLAAKEPSARPAELADDFPDLKPDFELPPELQTVKRNAHSSPLRISGPVIMWLHYDVGPKTPPPRPAFWFDEAEHGMCKTLGDGECSLSNSRL